MLKYLTCLILLFVFGACSVLGDSKHTFIKDNLYQDDLGNLYLKSRSNEEGAKPSDVWVDYGLCENCTYKNEKTSLKDFIDLETFKKDSSSFIDLEINYYSDKNYYYQEIIMADGGHVSITKKLPN
jgi:hypothetical protein